MRVSKISSFCAFAVLVVAVRVQAQMVPPLPLPTGEPLARIDLMTADGVKAFDAQWRYSDVKIVESTFNLPGPDRNTPGPIAPTYDIEPRAGEADFDDAAWQVITPESLAHLRGAGKICFNWYRISLTMPETIDGIDIEGMTAVLHCTVDDYAEVWVNGVLPRTLRGHSPNLVQGFNIPNRVTITQAIKPGEKIQLAIFGMNGPISAAPTNYIFFRDARIELHTPTAAPDPNPARPQE